MKTYLSIDIDFWEDLSEDRLQKDLQRLVNELNKRQIPIVAVMNHQQLLPLVSDSSARRLVNVDQHSDLADTTVEKLDCGTWVSYVSWRKKGEYVWIRRHSLDAGECNGGDPIFRERGGVDKTLSDWKKLSTKRVRYLPPLKELLKGVVAAGICLSPSFIPSENFNTVGPYEKVFRRIVRQFKIPYKRGLRNEHYLEQKRKPD